jgi:hypothetical protein
MPATDSKRAYRALKIALILSTIAFTWIASFRFAVEGGAAFPKMAAPIDLATALFGAAAISIFIFSLLVAILALYVWHTVENKMRAVVKEETIDQLEKIGNEVRGRTHAILGYIIGELSVDNDYQEPTDEERLKEAIFYCERAYELLKKSGTPTEYMALNNLLQYYCISGDKSRRGFVLDGARKLRVAASEHNTPNLLTSRKLHNYQKVIGLRVKIKTISRARG